MPEAQPRASMYVMSSKSCCILSPLRLSSHSLAFFIAFFEIYIKLNGLTIVVISEITALRRYR